ncbi:unnamed protein product [Cutaneotrichosporon oleaginosum]
MRWGGEAAEEGAKKVEVMGLVDDAKGGLLGVMCVFGAAMFARGERWQRRRSGEMKRCDGVGWEGSETEEGPMIHGSCSGETGEPGAPATEKQEQGESVCVCTAKGGMGSRGKKVEGKGEGGEGKGTQEKEEMEMESERLKAGQGQELGKGDHSLCAEDKVAR